MSDVFDQAVSHLSLTNDPARVAAVAIRLLDWIRKSPAACRCHCGVWRTSSAPTRFYFRNSPIGFRSMAIGRCAVRGRAGGRGAGVLLR